MIIIFYFVFFYSLWKFSNNYLKSFSTVFVTRVSIFDCLNLFFCFVKINYNVLVFFVKKILAASKNCSVVNTIYISSWRYTPMITLTKFQLNKRSDGRRQQPKWNLTLNKRWNWSSCSKLAVRGSERNSVVVGSSLT